MNDIKDSTKMKNYKIRPHEIDPSIEMDAHYKGDADPAYEMDVEERKKQAKQKEQYIIERYQNEEEMMVLIFAQFCMNHDLNPIEIYEKAYPSQATNVQLLEAIEKTVPKEESEAIPYDLLQQVLQAYGNYDLLFVLEEKLNQISG